MISKNDAINLGNLYISEEKADDIKGMPDSEIISNIICVINFIDESRDSNEKLLLLGFIGACSHVVSKRSILFKDHSGIPWKAFSHLHRIYSNNIREAKYLPGIVFSEGIYYDKELYEKSLNLVLIVDLKELRGSLDSVTKYKFYKQRIPIANNALRIFHFYYDEAHLQLLKHSIQEFLKYIMLEKHVQFPQMSYFLYVMCIGEAFASMSNRLLENFNQNKETSDSIRKLCKARNILAHPERPKNKEIIDQLQKNKAKIYNDKLLNISSNKLVECLENILCQVIILQKQEYGYEFDVESAEFMNSDNAMLSLISQAKEVEGEKELYGFEFFKLPERIKRIINAYENVMAMDQRQNGKIDRYPLCYNIVPVDHILDVNYIKQYFSDICINNQDIYDLISFLQLKHNQYIAILEKEDSIVEKEEKIKEDYEKIDKKLKTKLNNAQNINGIGEHLFFLQQFALQCDAYLKIKTSKLKEHVNEFIEDYKDVISKVIDIIQKNMDQYNKKTTNSGKKQKENSDITFPEFSIEDEFSEEDTASDIGNDVGLQNLHNALSKYLDFYNHYAPLMRSLKLKKILKASEKFKKFHTEKTNVREDTIEEPKEHDDEANDSSPQLAVKILQAINSAHKYFLNIKFWEMKADVTQKIKEAAQYYFVITSGSLTRSLLNNAEVQSIAGDEFIKFFKQYFQVPRGKISHNQIPEIGDKEYLENLSKKSQLDKEGNTGSLSLHLQVQFIKKGSDPYSFFIEGTPQYYHPCSSLSENFLLKTPFINKIYEQLIEKAKIIYYYVFVAKAEKELDIEIYFTDHKLLKEELEIQNIKNSIHNIAFAFFEFSTQIISGDLNKKNLDILVHHVLKTRKKDINTILEEAIETVDKRLKDTKEDKELLLELSKDKEYSLALINSDIQNLEGVGYIVSSDTDMKLIFAEDNEILPNNKEFSSGLASLGMKFSDVPKDGSCFFHVVAHQLSCTITYEELRQFAVNYVSNNRNQFNDFLIEETPEKYIERMSKSSQWADYRIIEALARDQNLRIVIIQNNDIDNPIVLGGRSAPKTIYIGHIAELHYVSLILENSELFENWVQAFTNKGLKYQEHALKMIQALYQGNHLYVARSLNNVGDAYEKLGDVKKGLEYFEQALGMYKALYQGNHCDIAMSLSYVGCAYHTLGDTQKGLEYQEHALKMIQALYQGNHFYVARSLNNVGAAYGKLGDVKKGLKYFEQALEMYKALYEGNDSDVAMSLNNVGIVYEKLGDVKKGLEYFEQALEMYKALYQGNHCDVAMSLNYVGCAYHTLGDTQKELEYQEQALGMYKALYQGNHRDVAMSLNYVGVAYGKLGDIGKSKLYSNPTKGFIIKRGKTSKKIIDIKIVLQKKVLNDIQELSAEGTWSKKIKKHIKEKELKKNLKHMNNKESLEIAQMLCFEAINIGIINSNKKNTLCAVEFSKAYPELVEKIAKEHPDYFINKLIVDACVIDNDVKKLVLDNTQKLIAQDSKGVAAETQIIIKEDIKLDNLQQTLKALNSAGNDNNLLTHGANRKYWYSIEDGFKLLIAIRQQLTFEVNVNPGEEYSTYRENKERVFVANPYYIDNFESYLSDDVARIIKTHNIKPKLLIIPLLHGLHWKCIKVSIDYESRKVDALFDDPYGKGRFGEVLKQRLITVLKTEMVKLIGTEISEVTWAEKELNQQGNNNGYDCGPIIFSNIRDYSVSSSIGLCYTVTLSSEDRHEEQMQSVRLNHIKAYGEVSEITIDHIRLDEIREKIKVSCVKRYGSVSAK